MRLVIVISVLARVVVAVWSPAVVRRSGNDRVLLLSELLSLVALHQLLAPSVGAASDGRMVHDVAAQAGSLPGLTIGLLALLVVLNWKALATRARSGGPQAITPLRQDRVFPALAIGLAATCGVMVISYFAWGHSQSEIRRTVASWNLALGRTVGRVALEDLGQDRRVNPQVVKQRLQEVWAKTDAPHDSYLCLIGPSGELEMNTRMPELQGTNLGPMVISEQTGLTVEQLLRARADWSGESRSLHGEQQLIGYHFVPSIDSLIAIHMPASEISEQFTSAVAPWVWSMVLVGGLLLPCSLGLLFHSSRRATKQAEAALQALGESEAKLRLLVDTLPDGVQQNDLEGRITFSNRAHAELHACEPEDLIGRYIWEFEETEEQRQALKSYFFTLVEQHPPPTLYEGRNRMADGRMIEVQVNWNYTRDSNGRPNGFISVISDVTTAKQIDRARQRSEEKYRRLVENSPFGIYEFELDGTLSAVNPAGVAMAELFNGQESQIHGVVYPSRLPAPDATRLRLRLDQARSGRTTQFGLNTTDGQNYDVCLIPLTDDRGIVQQIMGIAQDVSERKRSEAALRDSERLFRGIFEQAAVGVAQLDSNTGVILRVNPRYGEILGTPAESIVGKTWMELTHPDDLAADMAQMERLRSGKIRNFSLEKRLQRQDGTFVWIDLNVSATWQSGEPPSTHIAIVADITERKQAEESLRISEERYRSLVTASSVTVWITDADGGFNMPQPMWEAFSGQSWEEHQGYGWAKMLHPDDVERMTNIWRRVVADPQPYFVEGRIFHAAKGQYRYCEAHATPLLNPDGSVREWFGVTIDVHERRRAELELALRIKLQEAIRTIQSEFVAGAPPEVTFDKLLAVLLDITSGEYGFIGEILHDDDGTPFLKTYALTDIAWDDATRKFYSEFAPVGFEFRNLDTLFGAAITSGNPVISNDPANDPRRGGLPPGHPPLHAFMGLPIYAQQELIGLVGVGNPPGGFAEELVDLLEPFLSTCGNLITAFRNERKRQETDEALRESETRYRLITESAFDGLVVLEEGRIVDANHAFELMFGYPIEELRGKTPHAITTREYGDVATRRIEAGDESPYEIVGVTKAGREIYVEVLGRNFLRRGRPARVTAMRDITDRKRYEQQQRELHNRNTAIVSALGEIVYERRPQSEELTWQGEFTRILGYSEADMGSHSTTWVSRVHEDDVEQVTAMLDAARSSGRPYDLEYRFRDAKGHYRWMHDRGVPIVDDDGHLERFIGVLRDVTHHHAQAEELRRLNTSLEERVAERTRELAETNAELEAFAHTVSHDLRAPLRAMEGFATALAEDYGERLDEQAHEFIRHIVDSAQRMDHLVRDLLAYSRLGRDKLSMNPIDLNAVVSEGLRQLQADLESRQAQVDVAASLPTVLGHKSSLVQVIANLLANAIKFVSPHVRPVVRVWSEPVATGRIRLWVEDNGIGIEPEYQRRIFRVFERLHGIESYPGTGIGLAIVARGCERLGGRYGVESQVGRGSRFWIELPTGGSHK